MYYHFLSMSWDTFSCLNPSSTSLATSFSSDFIPRTIRSIPLTQNGYDEWSMTCWCGDEAEVEMVHKGGQFVWRKISMDSRKVEVRQSFSVNMQSQEEEKLIHVRIKDAKCDNENCSSANKRSHPYLIIGRSLKVQSSMAPVGLIHWNRDTNKKALLPLLKTLLLLLKLSKS